MTARANGCGLAGLALCLAVAGCGGDDTAVRLDAATLVARADEICRGGVERFAEIQAEAPANAKEAEEQTAELVEVASEELSALRELRPPEELRAVYERYLRARGRALEQLEIGREAAASRDTAAYLEAQAKVGADQPQRIKLAKAVGLKACSEP